MIMEPPSVSLGGLPSGGGGGGARIGGPATIAGGGGGGGPGVKATSALTQGVATPILSGGGTSPAPPTSPGVGVTPHPTIPSAGGDLQHHLETGVNGTSGLTAPPNGLNMSDPAAAAFYQLANGGGAGGSLADATEANKMFIGGLSWNTNEAMLYHHFSQFGEVVEHCVMRDPQTQRSRGFGFVKFADSDSVERVLAHPSGHIIDDKQVDPKRAVPKYQSKLINKTKKVFLGGLPPDTGDEDVKAHFSRFGEVEEVMLMYDRTTHRLRGFGFVKFVQEEAAENACREHYHEIKGKMVEAKKAQPKEVMTNMQLKKWSYGMPTQGMAIPDPSLPYYINGSRTPMFPPGAPYSTAPFGNFPYSPVMSNFPGSPTFQVTSPIAAAALAEQRGGTPNHFFSGDLIPSPFNGAVPTRTTTMSPSPLDSFSRDLYSSFGPPYLPPGSPRASITSPPLPGSHMGLDNGMGPGHDFASILATSPQQSTGFQFGSPFGLGVPPAMVAAYQGGFNQ